MAGGTPALPGEDPCEGKPLQLVTLCTASR